MDDPSKVIDGKKFVWDGTNYDDRVKAKEAMDSYEKKGFEVRLLQEDDQFLVYTRRVVTEIKVEDQS